MNNETGEPEFINTEDRATTLASHKDAGFDWMTITNYSQLGEVYPTEPEDVPSDFLWMFTSLEVPIKAGTDSEGVQEKIKHVCTFNTNVYTTDRDDGWYNYMSLQSCADLKGAIGCLVELAHPYWVDTYANPDALAKVKGGVRFCEVWDGLTEYHREVHDQGDNVQYPVGKGSDFAWEILLDNGCVCWATAISDVHSGLNNGVIKRGCVKVFSDALTRESILDGLLKGNFYASSNVDVALDSISFVDGVLTIGTGSASATTTFLKEGGEVIDTVTGATASYTMDGSEKYVRAVVKYPTENIDYEGNVIYEKIWIQPIINIFSY